MIKKIISIILSAILIFNLHIGGTYASTISKSSDQIKQIIGSTDDFAKKALETYKINKVKKNFKEDEVLVRFKDTSDKYHIKNIESKFNFKIKKNLKNNINLLKFNTFEYSLDDILITLNNDPNIEYAEPNYLYKINVSPNDDPEYNKLWGLKNTTNSGIDINIDHAWNITGGSSDIVVGVIDTGINYNHPDLINNIWVNTKEIPDNGIDDDYNGRIDDYYGWDFYNEDNSPLDDHNHGSHVSGIIAASDNEIGVIGVAPNVKLMALKVASAEGTLYTDDVIEAINYGLNKGVKIFNCSFGTSSYDNSLYTSMMNADALFICAAGNESNDNDANGHYPSSFPLDNIISVASFNEEGNISDFSNYGATTVDIAAPGDLIYSTLSNGSYGNMSGTSMATPYVTGAAAILLSENNSLSPSQIRQYILESTHTLPQLNGKLATGAILDVSGALAFLNPEIAVSVTEISLDKASLSLKTGENSKINATVSPSNATNKWVNWTSSNLAIATVDYSGLVSAVGEGSAVITAKTADGEKIATCSVDVELPDVDTTPPTLNSISIDRTSVTSGESVEITVDAVDEGGSGIKNIFVCYYTPITKKWKFIYFNSDEQGKYNGSITLTDQDESGIWEMYSIYMEDNFSNKKFIYNSNVSNYSPSQDFSNCNFELTGTNADIIPPELKSISIDKTAVVTGDTVNITIEAVDEGGSGIKYIDLRYHTPITKKDKSLIMESIGDGKYTASITLTDQDELGTWEIYFIALCDNVSNYTFIYNSNVSNKSLSQDFSYCDFEFKEADNNIKPLGIKYTKYNENYAYKTINGDLYIGPDSVLTINGSVEVNGNIYVLGALVNYGDLKVTGSIYARQFIFGKSTLYNGTVLMLGGSNSIGSMVATNEPFDIPFKVYEEINNTIYAYNDQLKITGATLPVIDLLVDGVKLEYKYNGVFELEQNVTDKDSITFSLVDIYGNIKNYTYQIIHKYYTGEMIPVTGISLDVSEKVLNAGENYKLNATVSPTDATNSDVIWTSDNTDVAVVNQDGTVTALDKGTSVITARTVDGGYTATCTITVFKPVSAISLDKESATIKIGESLGLIAAINPEDASNTNITWSSSNSDVAMVDQTGVVTGISEGTAVITVTTDDGGFKATCTITVVKPVTGVSLDKTEATLKIGENVNLIATVSPIDAADKSATWASSDPSVATVDTTGKVTAVGKGTAAITVTTVDGGFKATCAITVIKPVTGVSLDNTEVTLKTGENLNLVASISPIDATNTSVTWASSNPSVVTVDAAGKVTGVGKGTATITVTTVDGGFKATCKVIVVKPVTGISLDKTAATINKGETVKLIATISPVDAENSSITWSSSNPSVATVSNGIVTAVEAGTAIITVTTDDGGFTASCSVTVTANSIINKTRYGGANRFATAIEVSKAGWTTSENVVLVNAFGFADALTGVPFAHIKDAPILLTDAKVLTSETNDEIIRLKAKNIYILGGVGVVSQEIENGLRSRGYNVYRIAGSGRFETAIEIGKNVIESSGTKTAILTTAYNYPDALAISSYAAISGTPILYTDPKSFTSSTKNFIIQKGITKIIIPGGINAVSAAIENELKSMGITVQRIAGSDRYSTAYNIVNTFKASFKNDVMLATGKNFPDALAGGALAAKLQIPILLVQQNSIDDKSASYIRSKGTINLYVLGGTSVISDDIVNLIKP